MQPIGDRLKQAIRKRGFTQAQFAAKCGIPPSSLSQYLGDLQKPGSEALIKICRNLETSIDWLLSEGAEFPMPEVGSQKCRWRAVDIIKAINSCENLDEVAEAFNAYLARGKP